VIERKNHSMKKIILSLTFAAFALSGSSQKLYTENWDNGKKKSEGILYGATEFPKTDTKQDRAMKMANSLKDGKWQHWYENGTLGAEENYKMGVETGVWRTWFDNGSVSSVTDFESAQSVSYYLNGKKLSEGTMQKGMLKSGTWTGYFENGAKNYEGFYKNGLKDGQWTWWNEKGEQTMVENYSNGVKADAAKN